MKKILTILLCSLSLSSFAKETVTVVYSWTAADGPANYSRSLIAEANKIQDKYTFIFDTKPGAGGAVAAQHVARTPNTILATASAFFVRPNFFPNESYDLSSYKELLLQCTAPMAITASKYKNWNDVPTDAPLTIGVSGLGTTTHLFATQIQKKYPKLTVIPFKSTSESLLSMMSGNTDLHVAFLGEVEAWKDSSNKNKMHVLGISGTEPVRKFPTLVTQGFGKTVADISVPFHLAVPASISDDKFAEWRSILTKAAQTTAVKDTYLPDACSSSSLQENNLQPWYRSQVEFWRRLSTGVKL